MKAIVNDSEIPYGDLICSQIRRDYPHNTELSKCEKVEAITNLIIGTKEVRYGPLPNPESLVYIRNVIRKAIEKREPIPVLVPWGSIKADFSSQLDIAELSALQRIIHLNQEIEKYDECLEVVIRVEDTTGYSLFQMEADHETIVSHSMAYSDDMVRLVNNLKPKGSNIRVVLESQMANAHKFNDLVEFDKYFGLIYQYLRASNPLLKISPNKDLKTLPEYQALAEAGWKGTIPLEQREHYFSSYRKVYGDWSEDKLIRRLSLYFTGSWRRFQLNMTGKQDHWADGFIQLAFVPPIKGLPEGYNQNYVYYRTLPLSDARTHICPWRAKGYLRINGNDIKYKLASFSDNETISRLTPVNVTITNNQGLNEVIIKADYLLES